MCYSLWSIYCCTIVLSITWDFYYFLTWNYCLRKSKIAQIILSFYYSFFAGCDQHGHWKLVWPWMGERISETWTTDLAMGRCTARHTILCTARRMVLVNDWHRISARWEVTIFHGRELQLCYHRSFRPIPLPSNLMLRTTSHVSAWTVGVKHFVRGSTPVACSWRPQYFWQPYSYTFIVSIITSKYRSPEFCALYLKYLSNLKEYFEGHLDVSWN